VAGTPHRRWARRARRLRAEGAIGMQFVGYTRGEDMGIATLLLDRGLVTRGQLDEAVAQQRASGERLDRVLVRMGLVSPDQVLGVIGDQFHMEVVDLQTIEVKPDVLGLLPAKLVYRQNCGPVS